MRNTFHHYKIWEMNKKILIGLLTLLIIATSAKLSGQKLSFGCKGGFDLAQFTKETISDYPPATTVESYQLRPGFDLGFILNYQISKPLQIQIEPSLVEKGTHIKDDVHHFRNLFRIGYIAIPVTIIIKPVKIFSIEGGCKFGKLIYYICAH
jgi:hypothetical protein